MRQLLLTSTAFLLVACGSPAPTTTNVPSATPTSVAEVVASDQPTPDATLIVFLDQAWEEGVALSPEYQSYLGRKTNLDQWNDRSEAGRDIFMAMTQRHLIDLQTQFNREKLTPEGQLSYDLFVYSREQTLRLDKYRANQFAFSQFRGVHSSIPVTLANYHDINTIADAEAYIARISRIGETLGQAISSFETRAAQGNTLPEFSFPLLVNSARNVITGTPFTNDGDSPIMADFNKKISALKLPKKQQAALLAQAKAALLKSVQPAYEDFISRVEAIGKTVQGNYGLAGPDGNQRTEYYNELLRNYTTTNLNASDIHTLGLSEVTRIHQEMRSIMTQVGFDGSLQDFFSFMRSDPQFYKPNTQEGREEYLNLARGYIENIEVKLDELFITKPQAPVEVRRVEAFRERASGKAFYNQPAADGSRPGIFYANLLRMEDMPIYQLEALVYHEAIPGHHMQRSIQIEKQGLPKFRQFGGYTAYTEGWGLYSEYLGKDLGFYQDPYSDFGRLAMELWRAARLVVDTGLHAKGWEMQQAIDYLTTNTPNPEGDCVKAIERYIVYPGQATSYKIGMLKLLALRKNAATKLGDKFSLRDFHETVLIGGPVPLEVLEARIDAYIAEKQAG